MITISIIAKPTNTRASIINKVKDFSFQKVDSESVSPRNRLASLFNWPTPAPAP